MKDRLNLWWNLKGLAEFLQPITVLFWNQAYFFLILIQFDNVSEIKIWNSSILLFVPCYIQKELQFVNRD